MKLILIHNPKAGPSKSLQARHLVALLRHAGHQVVYQSVREAGWDHVLDQPADMVVAAGGDGTVRRVIPRLTDPRIRVAILPIGTANNVSRSLGLSDTPLKEVVSGWSTARTVRFATGAATGPWGRQVFIESVGAGFIASTMAKLNREQDSLIPGAPRKDDLRRIRQVFRKELQKYPAAAFSIRLDGQDFSGNYISVQAMNIQYVGPGLQLAPDANPTDGLLDLLLVPESDRSKMLDLLSSHDMLTSPSEPFRTRCGKRLEVKCHTRLHVDDKLWPDENANTTAATAFHLRIDGRVNMLVPRQRKIQDGKGGASIT